MIEYIRSLIDINHFAKKSLCKNKYYNLKLFKLQDLKNSHPNISSVCGFSNWLTLEINYTQFLTFRVLNT